MDPDRLQTRLDRSLTVVGKGRGTGGRMAERTIKKYRRYQREWHEWRRPRGYAMPATSEALAAYAVELLQRGYAVGTVRSRLNAVKALHRERGEPVPDGVAAWSVLRGLDPTADHPDMVNRPMARRGALVAVANSCDLGRAAHVRNLAMATLAWDIMASESELVAIDVGHVEVVDAGLLVRLDGGVLAVEHDHEPAGICPACCTSRWLDVLAAAGARSGPLFRSVDKGGNIAGCAPKAGTSGPDGRLNVSGLRKIWRGVCVRAGLPPSTPRALRLGGAADDVAEGGDLVSTLRRARWSPNTTAAVRLLVQAQREAQEGDETGDDDG